jgi:ribosome maturation factor RimP
MDAVRAEIERGGLELIDAQFRRTGNRAILAFTVDKEGGVTLDECAQLNRVLGDLLEESLSGSTFIEVNSPGLDRPLKTPKDFERVVGQRVKLAWRTEAGAGLLVTGKLLSLDGESLQLEEKQGKVTRIPLGAITKASRDIKI